MSFYTVLYRDEGSDSQTPFVRTYRKIFVDYISQSYPGQGGLLYLRIRTDHFSVATQPPILDTCLHSLPSPRHLQSSA